MLDFRLPRWVVPVAFAALVSTGCGDPDSAITLVPVTGVVTLKGEPMANARVAFSPQPGNKDETVGGDTTGPEGTYMAFYRNRSGLAPGKYQVTITEGESIDEEADSNLAEAFKDDPYMASEARRAASASARNRSNSKKPVIEERFDVEVGESATTLDFDLTGKTRESGKERPR